MSNVPSCFKRNQIRLSILQRGYYRSLFNIKLLARTLSSRCPPPRPRLISAHGNRSCFRETISNNRQLPTSMFSVVQLAGVKVDEFQFNTQENVVDGIQQLVGKRYWPIVLFIGRKISTTGHWWLQASRSKMASAGRITNCMHSSSLYNRGFCDP